MAGDEITAPARITVATVSAVPADTDPLARCPSGNACTDRINDSGNLMPWDSRVLYARPESLLGERVAVTDASSLHLDTRLPGARLGCFPLDNFQGPFWASDLRGTHLSHNSSDVSLSFDLRDRYHPRSKQLRLASRDSSCRAMGLLVRGAERDLTGFVETPNLFLR